MSRDPDYDRLPPEQRLGDGPVEAKHKEQLMGIAQAIDEFFNPKFFADKAKERSVGFVLLMFPYGEEAGRCNYVSNGANRDDIVVLMKEMIARFEGQPDIQGKA